MSEKFIEYLSVEETEKYVNDFLKKLAEYDFSEVVEINSDYWEVYNNVRTASVKIPKAPVIVEGLIADNPTILYDNHKLTFNFLNSRFQERFLKAVNHMQEYCWTETRAVATEKGDDDKVKEALEANIVEKACKKVPTVENNGGKTSYYDLPKPNRKKLEELLTNFVQQVQTREAISIPLLASKVIKTFPQTLNDLIEFKKMEFWRGEILKAAYGLDGRIQKLAGYDELSAEERELNKIIYYSERRKAIIQRLKEEL